MTDRKPYAVYSSKDAKKMEAVSPEVCSRRKGSRGNNLQEENSDQILGKEIAL